MTDSAHELTDKKLEEMEKRLTAIYSRAEKEIQKTADDYFAQFKRLDAEKRELVESGQLTEADYKAWRRNKILYSQRFKDMQEQAAQQLLHVNETAMAYINGQLPEVYSINYNALKDTVDGVGGYSFTLTDPQTIRHLSLTDSSLLPFKELDPAKDIPWNMKKINSEVLQGIITGDSIPKIAARIADVETMNLNAAVRTARTIVTEAENRGRLDSYIQAQEDGIELQREWISTEDSRTRPWHAELDGVVVDIDEPWENSIGKIMFPGDPDADGANVYNCRCTQVAKVVGFRKKETGGNGEDLNLEKFVPAKTIEEAQQYAGQFIDLYKTKYSGVVDYKGINIEYANGMNRALGEVLNSYTTKYPLKNIKPFNMREKRFKGETAEAAYQWGAHDLFYNKAYYKTKKAFNDHVKQAEELLNQILPNIDMLIGKYKDSTSTSGKIQLRYVTALKNTGRPTVSKPDAYGSMIHELGHYLDDEIFYNAVKERNFDISASFDKYSGKVSAYATSNHREYVAESFTSFWLGEKGVIDPELGKIFEELKK